jgi:hypothetical protein
VRKAFIAVILSAYLLMNLCGAPVKNVAHGATVAAKPTTASRVVTPQPAKIVVAIPQPPVPQGCAAYVPLLQQYDWNISIMAAVMQAESGCNPNAVNPYNYDGIGDYGLMQLHGQEIFDPATNVAHAYAIWQRQGYHAWSTYNSGAYLKYL